jgi:tetratricopeptide (TPR) repeat protein
VWQALREELKDRNFEVITVALDTGGAEAARAAIERASPTHPSLIDERHVVADLYGMVNVPTAVWIDEAGTIVRPPETPASSARMAELIGIGPTEYVDALRDWVANGEASAYIPAAGERRRRLHRSDATEALAATHFRLAEHLYLRGERDAARPHFEEALRLRPESWTYRRQMWANYEPQNNMNREWYNAAMATGDVPYYAPVQFGDTAPDAAATAQKQRETYEALFKPLMAPDP